MIKAARTSEAHSSGSSARSAALVDLGLVGKLRYGDETQECWWLVEATSRLGFTVRAAVLYSRMYSRCCSARTGDLSTIDLIVYNIPWQR
jgi:hypothetical protein